MNDREIWCRNHCKMASTGYFNLLGQPVGLYNKALARFHAYQIFVYVYISVMIVLTLVYVAQLLIGNCCSPERKHYRRLNITVKISPSASAKFLAVLGALLNIGVMGLILIYNDGAQGIVSGIMAWLMAGIVDGMLLCAFRDV